MISSSTYSTIKCELIAAYTSQKWVTADCLRKQHCFCMLCAREQRSDASVQRDGTFQTHKIRHIQRVLGRSAL